MSGARIARVVMSTGNHCVVAAAEGRLERCQLPNRRGRRPVCGDHVEWDWLRGTATIIRVLERRNVIERGDFRGQPRPLAANIDHILLVVAAEPAPDGLLSDRYRVLAGAMGVPLGLWVNKADLHPHAAPACLADLMQQHRALGGLVHAGSASTGAGVAALARALQGQTVILVGQSGVGKSSLTQGLIPSLELRIGAISQASGQGRHTTTETRLFARDDGLAIIDSPGVRTLRLDHLAPDDVDRAFPEVLEATGHCRFRNCRHDQEPQCGVHAAIESGRLTAARLERWRSLRAETQGAL